ncbi:MAG: diacylglycerol/lipid kinase family protein, partial [Gemmataceae bacterium]
MRTVAIYNPAAGRGRMRRQLTDLQTRLPKDWDYQATDHPEHAVELAQTLAEQGVEQLVAIGGDGTAHEVAHGLWRANQPAVRFLALPFGSMNDYAYSCGTDRWLKQDADPLQLSTRSHDVGCLHWNGKKHPFINGAGFGFNAMTTIESRKITWLRGLPLYSLAMVQALRKHFAIQPIEATIDNVSQSTKALAWGFSIGQ